MRGGCAAGVSAARCAGGSGQHAGVAASAKLGAGCGGCNRVGRSGGTADRCVACAYRRYKRVGFATAVVQRANQRLVGRAHRFPLDF